MAHCVIFMVVLLETLMVRHSLVPQHLLQKRDGWSSDSQSSLVLKSSRGQIEYRFLGGALIWLVDLHWLEHDSPFSFKKIDHDALWLIESDQQMVTFWISAKSAQNSPAVIYSKIQKSVMYSVLNV